MADNPRHSFKVGKIDDGSWLAYSDHAPYFCFEGSSSEQVRGTADRALKWYFNHDGATKIVEGTPRSKPKLLSTLQAIEIVELD